MSTLNIPNALAIGANQKQIDAVKEITTSMNKFFIMFNSLQVDILKAYDPCYSFCDCADKKDYTSLVGQLLLINSQLFNIKQSYGNLTATLLKNKGAVKSLKAQNDSLNNVLKNNIGKKSISLLKTKLSLGIKKNSDSIDEINETIEENQEKINTLQPIIDLNITLPSADNINKMIIFSNNLSEQNQEYQIDYIPLNGDLLSFTINIQTNTTAAQNFGAPLLNYYPRKIEIPIIGKPLISFSSGSFVIPGLVSKMYDWQQVPNNNNTITNAPNYILVETGYSLPPVGFSAFGNVEYKLSRNLGVGPSVGVGITIEKNPRLAYLGGVSAFLGENRQLVFTIGAALTTVNTLNNNLQTASNNQIIYPNNSTTISYYQELKCGLFFSISFTPFNLIKR
jgi:hypothetical protein